MLKKIKYNCDYSIQNIEEIKIYLFNPSIFKNLKTIEFNEIKFSFKNNDELI
jgi:hypothetical protein